MTNQELFQEKTKINKQRHINKTIDNKNLHFQLDYQVISLN